MIFFFAVLKKYCTIPSLGTILYVGESRALVSHDLENLMIHLAPIIQLDSTQWITWLRLDLRGVYLMAMQGREWTVIINWVKKWEI